MLSVMTLMMTVPPLGNSDDLSHMENKWIPQLQKCTKRPDMQNKCVQTDYNVCVLTATLSEAVRERRA